MNMRRMLAHLIYPKNSFYQQILVTWFLFTHKASRFSKNKQDKKMGFEIRNFNDVLV